MIYPVALFSVLFAVALLILPGVEGTRSFAEQRVGYGIMLLMVAGLDGLGGTLLALEGGIGDIPALVAYFLEGNWEHLPVEHQALVGPPLRDMYQLVVLGLGYLLLARGIFGQAAPMAPPGTGESDDFEYS